MNNTFLQCRHSKFLFPFIHVFVGEAFTWSPKILGLVKEVHRCRIGYTFGNLAIYMPVFYSIAYSLCACSYVHVITTIS